MNIKEQIRKSGLTQWEIAEEIGVNEFSLSRWLRRPENLGKERRELIERAILNLTKMKEEK